MSRRRPFRPEPPLSRQELTLSGTLTISRRMAVGQGPRSFGRTEQVPNTGQSTVMPAGRRRGIAPMSKESTLVTRDGILRTHAVLTTAYDEWRAAIALRGDVDVATAAEV